MKLAELLEIQPGVTAIIGGGGKTSLMYHLAEELEGRVICCTTTKIWPPEALPVVTGPAAADLIDALKTYRTVCVGTKTTEGKLTAPALPMAQISALADYVLVEADGSKGRPLKAHAAHEPVVPKEANQTILVVGLLGFGRPIAEAAHRPALYARLAQTDENAIAEPETAARVIAEEDLHTRLFCNQAEEGRTAAAAALASFLTCPVTCGSLREKWWRQIR